MKNRMTRQNNLWVTILAVALAALLLVSACAPVPTPTPTPTPPIVEPEPTPSPSPSPTPTPTPTPAIETLTYTNPEWGFSVDYPKDWDCEENIMGMTVLFAGPFLEEEQFMININIGAEELPEFPETTLEDYVRVSRLQVKKACETYNTLAEYNTVVQGVPAMVERYTMEWEGTTIMGTQAIFVKENVAYSVTYTATPVCHDDYLHCFELMLNTFEFA